MTPFEVICADAVECMTEMSSNSIDFILTSPPYDRTRLYLGKEPDWEFPLVAKHCFRLLKPGGVLCWNVNDAVVNGSETLTSFRQAIYFVDSVGFRMHDTMIYQKLNFSHPERTRYHSVFEYVHVLSKGAPSTFNPIMDRKNLTAGAVGNLGVNTFTERGGSKSEREKKVTAEFGMRHNVWLGKTRGQEEMCKELHHPAMMPKWLARDLILSWSNPGDLVLDPLAGSFTVCQEAVKVGRRSVGIEQNEEYCRLAIKQPAESPQ